MSDFLKILDNEMKIIEKIPEHPTILKVHKTYK